MVDGNGSFALSNLMECWGESQGLTEQEVLAAVKAHMFHEGDDRALRFEITSDRSGGVLIRALPKRHGESRGGGGGGGSAWGKGGSWNRTWSSGDWGGRGGDRESIDRRNSQRRGSGSAWPPRQDGRRITRDSKMEMALEDIIKRDPSGRPRPGAMHDEPGDRREHPRADRIRNAMGQMGHSQSTRHVRGGPKGGKDSDERLHRWLSWLFKSGHEELAVRSENGWFDLETVCAALRMSRPDMGPYTAAQLVAYLEKTDVAGRFQIEGNNIRKLVRDERQRRDGPAPSAKGGGKGFKGGRGIARTNGTRRSSSLSSQGSRRGGLAMQSPSPMQESEGSDLADALDQGLRMAPEREDRLASLGRPNPPPGEYWTEYQDEEMGWWHYVGPLGEWWCTSDNTFDIAPYPGAREE